jgi:hypothetical protein
LSEFAESKHFSSLEFLEMNPCSIKYESLSRTSNSEIDDCWAKNEHSFSP